MLLVALVLGSVVPAPNAVHPVGGVSDARPHRVSQLMRECDLAANTAGFAIACPLGGLAPGSSPLSGSGFSRGGGCGVSGPVRLPRWTWVGSYDPADPGHVVVASVPETVSPGAFVYLLGTAKPHRSARVTIAGYTSVRGHRGEYVHPSLDPRLDPYPRTGAVIFMGDTVLIWSDRGRTYAVGVAGGGRDARTVEATIARRLVFVRPIPRRSAPPSTMAGWRMRPWF